MSFLIDKLKLLGLNEREVRVFVALSTFGRMKMTRIAKRADLPRTTVDAIVRRLVDQGLVDTVTVGKHLEYEVNIEKVADSLDWLEKRFRSVRGADEEIASKQNQESYDEKNVINSGGHKRTPVSIENSFLERRGDRVRILLGVANGDFDAAVKRVGEYVSHAVKTSTKLEILTCSVIAHMLRDGRIPDALKDNPNLIRLNVVPSSYCDSQLDSLVFPDRILLRDGGGGEVWGIFEAVVVESVKHLLSIASETGWSVNLSAWVVTSGQAQSEAL